MSSDVFNLRCSKIVTNFASCTNTVSQNVLRVTCEPLKILFLKSIPGYVGYELSIYLCWRFIDIEE